MPSDAEFLRELADDLDAIAKPLGGTAISSPRLRAIAEGLERQQQPRQMISPKGVVHDWCPECVGMCDDAPVRLDPESTDAAPLGGEQR